MSRSFENQLDLALDTREQRIRQRQAEQDAASTKIQEDLDRRLRMQARFCQEVRSLFEVAVVRANSHLSNRAENCQLCDVSGYFSGAFNVGTSACNPIAFVMRENGREVGETLIIELTHGGLIEAFLGHQPAVPNTSRTRLNFGWRPIPIETFSAEAACDLVLRYVASVTERYPPGEESKRPSLLEHT